MQSKMTLKEWLPLLGITVSAFIFNTSEFMPIGLLTDIADSFHITEAHAGVLITVYSWIVMLLSLPLMLLLNKIDFKRLTVLDETKVLGGAGSLDIEYGNIYNLNLTMGAGKTNISALFKGSNKITTGVGEFNINLFNSLNDYKVKIRMKGFIKPFVMKIYKYNNGHNIKSGVEKAKISFSRPEKEVENYQTV